MENGKLKDTLRVFVVPTEILDTELNIYEKMVYMVLRSYANGQDDTAFPSYNTIAQKGSMSKRKAIDCVKRLEELGLIKKEERLTASKNRKVSQTSNLYTIYRPSDLVHSMHEGSAQHARGVVHNMHEGSAQHAPKKNQYKKQVLKNNIKSIGNKKASVTKQDLIDICNNFYTKFSSGRWNKKQWIKLVDKIAEDLINNIGVDHINNLEAYLYKTVEKMAYNHDAKHTGLVENNNNTTELPFYNWLTE